jgi:hypothetical protein
MANEGYHEPLAELTDKTKDMHRALTSLGEELEVSRSILAQEFMDRPHREFCSTFNEAQKRTLSCTHYRVIYKSSGRL